MSGAGVTINPVAFLVVQSNTVKLMPVTHSSSLDKLLDYVPDLLEILKKKNIKIETNDKIKKPNINKKPENAQNTQEEFEYDETKNNDYPEDD